MAPGSGIHGLDDGERLQVITCLAQLVATGLETFLNGDADALHSGPGTLADLEQAA